MFHWRVFFILVPLLLSACAASPARTDPTPTATVASVVAVATKREALPTGGATTPTKLAPTPTVPLPTAEPTRSGIVGVWHRETHNQLIAAEFFANGELVIRIWPKLMADGRPAARSGQPISSIPMNWRQVGPDRIALKFGKEEKAGQFYLMGDRLILPSDGETQEYVRAPR